VNAVLASDYLTTGPMPDLFEEALCEYAGARYAVVCSSGTAALHLACRVADLAINDEIITSPFSFLASANCALYCGAQVRFADVDEENGLINPSEIRKRISPKTQAIIPVHYAGIPVDMSAIHAIAEENQCIIIEDAAHAFGSSYANGERVGSCCYSDMTACSFHPVKTIATGEGGVVFTNDKALYERLKKIRNHGIERDKENFMISHERENIWYYEMQDLGFNYRLSDIHAALGLSQLKKVENFIQRRGEIHRRYNEAFSTVKNMQMLHDYNKDVAYHLSVARIDFFELGISRNVFMERLRERGVGTQVHYVPIHLQPYYQEKFGYRKGDYPIAESLYKQVLSLPNFPSLTVEEQDYVVASIKELL
jgi:perosamine synthetase